MRKNMWMVLFLSVIFSLAGCGNHKTEIVQGGESRESTDSKTDSAGEGEMSITLTEEIMELENGFSAVRYDGDYGFDRFLSEGGASSDQEVVGFLTENLLSGMDVGFSGNVFGCSTIAVQNSDGESLFGRNFDWNHCEGMAVLSHPENGYASISTVNMDFISQSVGGGIAGMALNLDEATPSGDTSMPFGNIKVKTLAALILHCRSGWTASSLSSQISSLVIRLLSRFWENWQKADRLKWMWSELYLVESR